MTSNCVICGSAPHVKPSLPQIIDTFRVILQVLETQALKLETENAEKLEKLNQQINEVTAQSRSFEEAKVNAEKRSDLYKSRFLDAQKAIEQLHEKNVQLSAQRSQKFYQPCFDSALKRFPFVPKDSFSQETTKVILAPDTCAPETESHHADVTYISSDEEDFRQESKGKNKPKSPRNSPRAEQCKTPQKSVMESFFVRPKSLPKKRKISSDTPNLCTDLDETRLDSFDPMDTSISLDIDKLQKFDEEMDSIPPSPVLSGGKGRRFGAFQRSRGGSFSKREECPAKENRSPRGENRVKKFPLVLISLKAEDNNPSAMKLQNKLGDSHSRQQEQRVSNQREPASTGCSDLPGNTSLDELFDKTYGDLETTTMLNDATSEIKDERELEESDDDLDALLLYGVDDDVLNPTPVNPTSSIGNNKGSSALPQGPNEKDKLRWEDSFDVAPKKQEGKNFKYQEVVRKHDERERLDGKACAQCDAYYGDVPEEERRELLKKVCRHKHVNAPPSTPEHFWEIGIPNTEECRKRGYFTDEKDLPPEERIHEPRLRRKKPLEPFFSKKK